MNTNDNRLAGLRRLRKDTKEKNSAALKAIIDRLKVEKPNEKWSYKDICAAANLKSQNSLKAPWNGDTKREIDTHNEFVRSQRIKIGREVGQKNSAQLEKSHSMDLRLKLDAALHQIGIWEAEAAWLASEYENLKKINNRLESRLHQVTAELHDLRRGDGKRENDQFSKISKLSDRDPMRK